MTVLAATKPTDRHPTVGFVVNEGYDGSPETLLVAVPVCDRVECQDRADSYVWRSSGQEPKLVKDL